MDHLTLLEPEAVVEKRGVDTDTLAATIKSATNAVIAHDASHPGTLPSELDVVLVARTGTKPAPRGAYLPERGRPRRGRRAVRSIQ